METAPASIDRTRQAWWILVGGLLLGLVGNYLLYGQAPGLGYALFTLLVVAVMALVVPRYTPQALPRQAWPFLAAIAFFGVMLAIRANGFLTFLNVVIVFYLGLLIVGLWRGRELREMGPLRYLLLLTLPIEFLLQSIGTTALAATNPIGRQASDQQRAVVRGVLLAIPLVILFTWLLGSADLVIGTYLDRLIELDWLFENPDFMPQVIFVMVLTLFFTGALAAVILRTLASPALESTTTSKFEIGRTEQLIVLGALAVLFGVFILVQLSYLFAGASLPLGFTYAEYARRGFVELLVTSGLVMAIIWGLRTAARAQAIAHERPLLILKAVLVAETLAILVSAAKRLALYEAAYGFTVARLWAHGIVIVLAFLLIGFAWLALRHGRDQEVVLVTFATLLVFVGGMNLLNPDAFIARQNLAFYEETSKLDTDYLGYGLSADAVPVLMAGATAIEDDAIQEQLLVHLGDTQSSLASYARTDWRSWHLARTRALYLLNLKDNATLIQQAATKQAAARKLTSSVCMAPDSTEAHYAPVPTGVAAEFPACPAGSVHMVPISIQR